MEDLAKVDKGPGRRAKAAHQKKRRSTVDGEGKDVLSLDSLPDGARPRWVINNPERVQRLLDAGYEFVHKSEVGEEVDTKVDSSAGTSSLVERRAGGGQKFVLMKLPNEYYEEDQKARHQRELRTEAALKREARQDRYGSIDISEGRKPLAG